jgi:hypothetical protein
MVANEATKDAIWLRHLLDEMGIVQKGPMKICCDNQSYMALTRNPEFHGRTKHIKIQMDYIRSKVELCSLPKKKKKKINNIVYKYINIKETTSILIKS